LARRRPRRGAPGGSGCRIRHASSVRSLAWRRPARLCCHRVAGVRIASFVQGVATRSNHDAARPSSPAGSYRECFEMASGVAERRQPADHRSGAHDVALLTRRGRSMPGSRQGKACE
jgi:hypothetical protein